MTEEEEQRLKAAIESALVREQPMFPNEARRATNHIWPLVREALRRPWS